MRVGRNLKTLSVLCVIVVVGFYVFYASFVYTGTDSSLRVTTKSNDLTNARRDKAIRKTYAISRKESEKRDKNKRTKTVPLNVSKSKPDKHRIPSTSTKPTLVQDQKNVSNFAWHNNDTTTSYDVTSHMIGSDITTDQLNIDRVHHNIVEEHDSRLRNLHFSCASQVDSGCNDVRKCNLTDFYYSRQYNFAYCKVPKSGSTFWMKLFLVLHHGHSGDRYSRMINTWSRSDIHSRSRALVTPPMKIYRDKIPTVIVSRNPYSRLYSAYIDKVFMPLFWHLFEKMAGSRVMPPFWINKTVDALKKSNKPISKRLMAVKKQMEERGLLKKLRITTKVTPVCANNASFTDFLNFIISVYKSGRVLEPHWAPINNLCRPCLFNTEGIIKQESFSEDVFHTINSFKINNSGLDSLKTELFDRRVENSIPGIVGVVERKAATKDIRMCISSTEITRRLWRSFQIQGYISDKVDAPSEILTGSFNKKLIVAKAMEALLMEPVTSEQRANQRRGHLIKAYSNISPDIIQEIQTIFKADFELFDYSMDPPK